MSASPGYNAFKLSFEISPIMLSGGIAQAMPGGILPIVALTESVNFTFGLLSGSSAPALESFFANFQPMPGASLISQKVGTYPFANQAVAANAVIADPLAISMLMLCPARGEAGYAVKLATMTALQATLAQHNALGGTYTIATPSFFYTNCLFLDMRDATPGGSKQYQSAWVLNFMKPLLTLDQAAGALNNLMGKISGGSAISGQPAWSGLEPTVGVPPSLAAPSIIPSSTGSAASNVAAAGGGGGGNLLQ